MREIKFRVWVTEDNEFWTSDEGDWKLSFHNGNEPRLLIFKMKWVANPYNSNEGYQDFYWDEIEIDNSRIQQYTGLKDKNGREIYEGDIIRILDDEEFDGWNEKVIFHRSCFMAGDENLLVNVHFRSVVKGNIYEHPHLLEGDAG